MDKKLSMLMVSGAELFEQFSKSIAKKFFAPLPARLALDFSHSHGIIKKYRGNLEEKNLCTVHVSQKGYN